MSYFIINLLIGFLFGYETPWFISFTIVLFVIFIFLLWPCYYVLYVRYKIKKKPTGDILKTISDRYQKIYSLLKIHIQCLDQNCGGLLFDIKGDVKNAVTEFAAATKRELVFLGPNQHKINLLEGLTPEVVLHF